MTVRADHRAIAARVPQGARVIDIGCASGELLALLEAERGAIARGLELDPTLVASALSRGLSVMQGDADGDLDDYPDNAFDVAVLSKAIQEMRRPGDVLRGLSRIAPDIVMSFRNYGHWRRRLKLLTTGRMPTPRSGAWHAAAALHPCTVIDMADLVHEVGLDVIAAAAVSGGEVGPFRRGGLGGINWRAEEAILHLRRKPTHVSG